MKILVDENIPYGLEAFGSLGEVETAPGRSITRDMLLDVDALMVRSITKVNAELLDGTPVRFVGTATIGEDHIDKAWLAEQGIGFTSAPGCNANSVAEYIVAALLELRQRYALDFSTMSLGVVGVGNVGSKVVQKAKALGLKVVQNDPPLAEQTGDPVYESLEAVQACDIITFHVPLNKTGPHPTHQLADKAFLTDLKESALLFNTSRGAVVDNKALKDHLGENKLREAVLDVWESEPTPDLELLSRCFIATPHIAGYSFDGKVNGTVQIYQALCAHLGLKASWSPKKLLPPPDCPVWEAPDEYEDPFSVLHQAVRAVYPILEDDVRMRGILEVAPKDRGAYFDRLRKEYPRRREFQNTKVVLDDCDTDLKQCFVAMGFQVAHNEVLQ